MATNLLLGTNSEVLTNLVLASASDVATGWSVENARTGPRGKGWKADAAGTAHWLRYRFATSTAVNYFAVCDAVMCVSGATTPSFTLKYSSDAAIWTNWRATGTLTTASLMGPNAEDYAYYNATSAANTYWQLDIGYGGNYVPELSKLYLGTALDLGRDPYTFNVKCERTAQSQRKARRTIGIEWAGVSHANTLLFVQQVANRQEWHPIILLTSGAYANLLHGWTMMHVEVLQTRTPQTITNQNDIGMTVRELI